MRSSLVAVAALLGLAACADAPVGVAPLAPPAASRARAGTIPGEYIVLLKGSAGDVSTAARTKVARGRGTLRRAYTGAVRGFAATLSPAAAAELRADPQVLLVEEDREIRLTGFQSNAPWGLDRLDQRALPLSGSFEYAADGSGVTVYVVDTGINYGHVEFGGRAGPGWDAFGGDGSDCHGHGTHVAGIVAGATYGVAKGARVVAARVLDCDGSGRMSSAVAALDWVTQRKRSDPGAPMVVNFSLTGGGSSALDQAVAAATAVGVVVVAAAGNDGGDACGYSPARASQAITVGAADAGDHWAGFSNGGGCVDVVAPGVSIPSAWIGGSTSTVFASGTSMASPHVAGAAAVYLSANGWAGSTEVVDAIVGGATSGVVNGVPAGTPNRLLFVAAGEPPPPPAPAPPEPLPPEPVPPEPLPPAPVPPEPVPPAPVPPPETGPSGVQLASFGSDKCMDVWNVSRDAGANVVIYACHGQANQRWSLPAPGSAGEVRVYGDMCLDAAGGNGNDGDPILIYGCHGGANQRWTLTDAGELQGINGKCVDVSYARIEDGAQLTLYACHGGTNQRWTVRP